MNFIEWLFSFFYTFDTPLPMEKMHGPISNAIIEKRINIEDIKFKKAFDKIQKYNILEEADLEYIKNCRNEKMMEYIRNIEDKKMNYTNEN